MAKNGKYKAAIDDIPQDYRKSDTRTYLSAPFLNSLASMNTKLDSIEKNIREEITKKAKKDNYDYVFAKSVLLYGGKDITDEIKVK